MNTFNTFVGNSTIKNSLRKYIFKNNMFHAIILQGEKGLGKKTLSKIAAKTILCKDKDYDQEEACQKCSSCLKFDENNHPDVIYMGLDKKKSDKNSDAEAGKAKSIGIEKVKELIHKNSDIKPYESRNKIFIIEDAELMTVAAQNAILKTIEEPNEYNIFILLVQNEKLFLQTILSRCIMLRLRNVETKLCAMAVEKHLSDVTENEALKYAVFTGGNIGKAINYVNDEIYMDIRIEMIRILKNMNSINSANALLLAKEISKYKEQIKEILDIFLSWYRDLLLIKHKKNNILMIDYKEVLIIEEREYSIKRLCHIIEEIEKAKTRIRQNANLQMTMDILLLQFIKK